MLKTVKVHLRNESGHPEMRLVVAHITGVTRDIVNHVHEVSRATITTTSAGQLIRTTETYEEVLQKLEIQ